jgi:hypothetical protein
MRRPAQALIQCSADQFFMRMWEQAGFLNLSVLLASTFLGQAHVAILNAKSVRIRL